MKEPLGGASIVSMNEPKTPSTEVDTIAAPKAQIRRPPLERGTTIDRYTVLELLGSGGMGEVYAAYDAKLDRKVALKVLHHRGAIFEARLAREAQAMARLSHPNVVTVFDTGKTGDRLFVAMEFVQGVTLRRWRKSAPRDTASILRTYVEAGRGLSSAHAASLVHRDFKPDNVLVAMTGQIKVTDFGIVRAIGESDPLDRPSLDAEAEAGAPAWRPDPTADSHPPTTSLSAPMTEVGDLLGTPGYMAPEQILHTDVDARTDQYAFCVALYEALYGDKPFTGDSPAALVAGTVLGARREVPAGVKVSPHIERVLLRGLSHDAKARYPTMDELLLDLVHDPARERRRFAVGAGLALVAALVVAMGVRAMGRERREMCAGPEREATSAWNETVDGEIARAFTATGVPYARDTWNRAQGHIATYLADWAKAGTNACEATRLRHEQSQEMLSAVNGCLEQRREEVVALLHVLARPDRDVVDKAIPAAMGLTPVASCTNRTTLTTLAPEPWDPAVKTELAGTKKDVAELMAFFAAGKFGDAREKAKDVVARARAVGYEPLLGRALFLSARARATSADNRDIAITEAKEAIFHADAGRDDITRVDAASRLVHWLVDSGRYADAEVWSRVGEGALTRAGMPDEPRAVWLSSAAWLVRSQGRFAEAEAKYEDAMAIARRTGNLRLVSEIGRILAPTLASLGKVAEATSLIRELDDLAVRTFGEEHPERLSVLISRSYVAALVNDDSGAAEMALLGARIGDKVAPENTVTTIAYQNACLYVLGQAGGGAAAALPYCEDAVKRCISVFGKNSLYVADVYTSRGFVYTALGRPEDAVVDFDRALAIPGATKQPMATLLGKGEALLAVRLWADAKTTLEDAIKAMGDAPSHAPRDEMRAAVARFRLAEALWELGTERTMARSLAEQAVKGLGAPHDAALLREATSWLAEHPVREL